MSILDKINRVICENINYDLLYPVIKNNSINDFEIIDDIPNMQSIESTLYNYDILSDIRKVPMDVFDGPSSVFYAKDDFDNSRNLANQLNKTKKIKPLIIVHDKEGPYILEGAHRYVALYYLNAKYLPAIIVIDLDNI